MPSGRIHLRIEAVLLVALGAVGGWLASLKAIEMVTAAAFVASYALSMLLLSPDLDLRRSRAFARWGLFRWLWIPYAAVFRHRQVSHHPIVGPLTRILYLSVIVALVGLAVCAATGWRVSPCLPQAEILVALVAGLYLPNLVHILADRVDTGWKRARARRRL